MDRVDGDTAGFVPTRACGCARLRIGSCVCTCMCVYPRVSPSTLVLDAMRCRRRRGVPSVFVLLVTSCACAHTLHQEGVHQQRFPVHVHTNRGEEELEEFIHGTRTYTMKYIYMDIYIYIYGFWMTEWYNISGAHTSNGTYIQRGSLNVYP